MKCSFKNFTRAFNDDDDAAKSVRDAHDIGQGHSLVFMQEKLTSDLGMRKSLYGAIKKIKLLLFRSKNVVTTSSKAAAMKERIQLYSSLYVGCKFRQANLDDFFRHENHEYPPSIPEYGKIRKPTAKSDFLKCLPTEIDETVDQASVTRYDAPLVDDCITDGPALVQMNAPKLARTYGEYREFELGSKVKSMTNGAERIYIAFDVYKANSRKRETRESRGKGEGGRFLIKKNTPVYRDGQK